MSGKPGTSRRKTLVKLKVAGHITLTKCSAVSPNNYPRYGYHYQLCSFTTTDPHRTALSVGFENLLQLCWLTFDNRDRDLPSQHVCSTLNFIIARVFR